MKVAQLLTCVRLVLLSKISLKTSNMNGLERLKKIFFFLPPNTFCRCFYGASFQEKDAPKKKLFFLYASFLVSLQFFFCLQNFTHSMCINTIYSSSDTKLSPISIAEQEKGVISTREIKRRQSPFYFPSLKMR